MNRIVNELLKYRDEHKLTQTELADILGTTRASIAGWEIGKSHPKQSMLTKIADLCKVSTDYLLGNTDIRTPLNIQQFGAGVQSELVKECHELTDAQAQQILDLIKSFKK